MKCMLYALQYFLNDSGMIFIADKQSLLYMRLVHFNLLHYYYFKISAINITGLVLAYSATE